MEDMINFLNANINETIKAQLADDELVEHMYYIDAITAIPSLCATLCKYKKRTISYTGFSFETHTISKNSFKKRITI